MALFNTGAIILLVPVYDQFIEPWMTSIGRKFTLLQRIGWGMVIAVLAMLYAAAVESARLRIFRDGHAADPNRGAPEVVALNIMWQAPAYVLVGASEVLASIGQLEFFYDQAPDVMRSCSMALQLLSSGVGSYLGGGLIAAVQAASGAAGDPWLPKDLNLGHMDYFYVLTALIMLLNVGFFVWVALSYEYKAVEHRTGAIKVPTMEEAGPLLLHGGAGAGDVRGAKAGGALPPRAPRQAGAAGSPVDERGGIAIAASAARRGAHGAAARGVAASDAGESEDGLEVYSRSLAYFPTSPALPAPFR